MEDSGTITKEQFLELLREFEMAAGALSEGWERLEDNNFYATQEDYPFDEDFDSVLQKISIWRQTQETNGEDPNKE